MNNEINNTRRIVGVNTPGALINNSFSKSETGVDTSTGVKILIASLS